MTQMEELLTQADFSRETDRMNRLYTTLFQKPMPAGKKTEARRADRFEQKKETAVFQ